MKDNPYSLILNTMQGKQDNQGVLIGLVTSTSPFTVKVGDLSVGKGNLLVADHLLKGYKRKYKTDRTITSGVTTGTMEYTDTLLQGDRVAVFPTNDRQMYLVLAKLKEV